MRGSLPGHRTVLSSIGQYRMVSFNIVWYRATWYGIVTKASAGGARLSNGYQGCALPASVLLLFTQLICSHISNARDPVVIL